MTTAWAFPNTIIQYAEPGAESAHIRWDDSNDFRQIKNQDSRSLQSVGALEHIARSPKHDLKNKTYFLQATNFSFIGLPTVIQGIELKLVAQRYGRASDDTVQLWLQSNVIGVNKATTIIKPEKLYGGSTDVWGIDNISAEDILDPNFGILLRFKAHPDWPHTSPILIDSVEMRIH